MAGDNLYVRFHKSPPCVSLVLGYGIGIYCLKEPALNDTRIFNQR